MRALSEKVPEEKVQYLERVFAPGKVLYYARSGPKFWAFWPVDGTWHESDWTELYRVQDELDELEELPPGIPAIPA